MGDDAVRRVVVATRNAGKIAEIRAALDIPGYVGDFLNYEDFCQMVFGSSWYFPEGQIVAADGDRIVGLAALGDYATAGYLVNNMTGVLPEYRGRTLLLVLPDHGRELERLGGSGFIHHSDFYTNARGDEGCRRVWMLALGPGIRAGRHLGHPVPLTAAAATGLEYLGLPASPGAAPSVLKQAL